MGLSTSIFSMIVMSTCLLGDYRSFDDFGWKMKKLLYSEKLNTPPKALLDENNNNKNSDNLDDNIDNITANLNDDAITVLKKVWDHYTK